MMGAAVYDVIARHNVRPGLLKELYERLRRIQAEDPTLAGSTAGAADTAEAAVRDQARASAVGSAAAGAEPPLAAAATERPQTAPVGSGRTNAAPAAAAAPTRRGGYGDSGGVTTDGVLPVARPLCVASEKELRAEMDKVSAGLQSSVAWNKRINAMVQLEGLVKGNAADYLDAFVDALKLMKDSLTFQLGERRSAVSRQACHLLCCLAAFLGHRYEPFALHFMPAIIKVRLPGFVWCLFQDMLAVVQLNSGLGWRAWAAIAMVLIRPPVAVH